LQEVDAVLATDRVKNAGGGEITASVPGSVAFKEKKTTNEEGGDSP